MRTLFIDLQERDTQINRILEHNLRFNGSYESMESMARDVVNTTPGARIKVPSTMYKIRKSVRPIFEYLMQYKCAACNNLSTDSKKCDSCGAKIDPSRSNYFVCIPIKQQLIEHLNSDLDEIIAYYNRVLAEDQITDIHNSQCFQNVQKKYRSSIILPLIVNTDGAKVHRTSTNSLWMLQCYQAFLHPSKRYMPPNILIAAAHFGEKKPNMNDLFYMFLKDIREIQNDGGINLKTNGEEYNFMPVILGLCCDIPAKKEVLCTVGHAGHFACDYCLHPGISYKSSTDKKTNVRYLKGTRDYGLRSHESIIDTYKRLKKNSINGITGISPMVAARHFDLVNGVSIDYMHAALLGVMKKMLNLWLETKNHANDYYIKKPKQITLSNRLVSQKPISDVIRKPRSITMKNEFKANEYRTLLLYHLRFALAGLLPQKYIKHFVLFSNSIYELSRHRISSQNIEKAQQQLNKFVDEFEILYGKSNVTINLHLMRHLATCVRTLGPLWVHSAFGFEANNGVISKSITSKKDILHQLSWKYAMKNTLKPMKPSDNHLISEKKVTILDNTEKDLISQSGMNLSSSYLTIYRSVVARGIKFSSLQSKEKQTIDYFIRVGAEIYCIHFFYIFDSIVYALLENYAVINEIDHFSEVRGTKTKIIMKFADIDEKLLYLKFGTNEYVTSLPNKYEKT